MNQGKFKGAGLRCAALTVLLALLLSLFAGCAETGDEEESGSESRRVEVTDALTIPLSELSPSIVFYSFEIDGLEMEVLAAKDSDGTVRTAFNTCQVCNGSRMAYFVKSGNYVVCQNCRNRFGLSQVGIVSGGCNPYPITAADRVETEDSIQLSYEFLSANKYLFEKWKNN
ncbi:MAG: DUF2318 domain-containing protein [Eubacteriales bacterium]